MLNLTINELRLRLIAKGRSIGSYQKISRKELEDLFIGIPIPFSRHKYLNLYLYQYLQSLCHNKICKCTKN